LTKEEENAIVFSEATKRGNKLPTVQLVSPFVILKDKYNNFLME